MPEQPMARKVALIAYLFLVTASFGFLQPFVPLYFESAGLDRREIGYLLGIGTGASLLLQPLWGRLSDHFDTRRPFILLCAIAAGAAYLSFPSLTTPLGFLTLYAIGQNGVLYLNAVGGVLVGRLVQSSRGGAEYANYRVWGSVGYIVVSLLTGWILNSGSHTIGRPLLDKAFSTVPFIFVPIAALAFLVPDARTPNKPVGRTPKPDLPPNLKVFLISHFFYTFALYGASSFLSLYMKELGGTPFWVTLMFAGGVVCEVLVMRQSGKLSDRYGRRPLMVLTFGLLPVRLLLYTACVTPMGVFLVQLLHGLNFGIMGVIAVALINDLATDATRGQAQARLATVTGAATTVGPIAFGWVAEFAGLRGMFFSAAAVALVGSLILILRVQETHPDSKRLGWRKADLLHTPPFPPKPRP